MESNMIIRKFNIEDTNEVVKIWEECGLLHPPNDPYQEIKNKMEFQPNLFLVGEVAGKLMATIMLGYEGRRGWINSLGVLPEYQGRGYGSELVRNGVEALRDLGTPKINLLIRPGNSKVKAFYQKLGFETEEVIMMTHRFKKEK